MRYAFYFLSVSRPRKNAACHGAVFKLTVESNYTITTLKDWLKNLAPGIQAMRSKPKTNHNLYARLPRFG